MAVSGRPELPPASNDELSVTVLGASGSYPGAGRASSGYLVEGGGVRVLLDLGSGCLANLFSVLAGRAVPPVSPDEADAHLLDAVDAVVLSHEHPDHWMDLSGMRVALRYGSGRSGVPLHLTEGTLDLAVRFGELEPTFVPNVVRDGDVVAVGGLTFRFAATDHYVPTLACRVEGGTSSMAYSADTGPGWSMRSLGPPVDLALVEASHLQGDEARGVLHLSARQAGAVATEAGARSLVLTHLVPGVDREASLAEAAGAFDGPIASAHELDRYVVGAALD